MCEGAVQPVLGAVAPGICLVDAGPRLVVAEVVLALRVPCCAMQVRAPRTDSTVLLMGSSGRERASRADSAVGEETLGPVLEARVEVTLEPTLEASGWTTASMVRWFCLLLCSLAFWLPSMGESLCFAFPSRPLLVAGLLVELGSRQPKSLEIPMLFSTCAKAQKGPRGQ